jgi:hypothetical protein
VSANHRSAKLKKFFQTELPSRWKILPLPATFSGSQPVLRGAASGAAGWQLRKIASSHLPFITHPREPAGLLLEVAG